MPACAEESGQRKSVPREQLLADLDRLEARAARITVPLSYTDELYALRTHIDLVRARLQKQGQTWTDHVFAGRRIIRPRSLTGGIWERS